MRASSDFLFYYRKNHQQEREAAKIFDEAELTIQQERSILQEKVQIFLHLVVFKCKSMRLTE